MSQVMRKAACRIKICKTKAQIRCAVTVQLINAFVFATQIVQYLFILNQTLQASSHILNSPVYVQPGWKPRRQGFSPYASSVKIWKISV